MSFILVYTDKGACPLSVKSLLHSLAKLPHPVKTVDSQFLSTQEWEKDSTLLIMPGGRDKPYQTLLQGHANQKIRAFVRQGGSYLGLCAGAYYGCSSIEFEKGTSLEICEERELKLFPGIAEGPAYGVGYFQYESTSGSRLASLILNNNQKCSIYFNGGCFFTHLNKQTTILARYADITDQPPAIIHTQFGSGNVILSGVHPEFTASALPPTHPFYAKLKVFEKEHYHLFCSLITVIY